MSQGSGRNIDMARIQRPVSELNKFFTLAFSYPSAFYNQQVAMVREFRTGNIPKGTAMAVYTILAGPIAAAFLTGDWPDDKEDLGEWLFNRVMFGAFAGVPLARDLAMFGQRKASGEYAVLASTPVGAFLGGIDTGVKLATGEYGGSKPLQAAITSAGFVFGIGGAAQIGKSAEFVADVLAGNESPENAAEWVEGVLKGKLDD
jgi:hypothetical protein